MVQYNTRIKMKSDTATNWATLNSSTPNGFVPLDGEIIIFTDNNSELSRMKIGDGETNVINLPFIDAGTINGKEVEIVKLNAYTDRPLVGSSDKLYVDLSTSKLYHYYNNSYREISNVSFTKTGVSEITFWRAGIATTVSVEDNVLKIVNGTIPSLTYNDKSVVHNIGEE